MRTADTGLTHVALGLAGLFAIATIVVVVWGVMQRQALDEVQDAQAELRQQLDAHPPNPSAWPQPVDPPSADAPSPPTVNLPDSQPASVPAATNPDTAVDPIWALSGDTATDEELMALAANRCAGEGYIYDEINLPVRKRAAIDKLKQRFYAQQMHLERQPASDPNDVAKRVQELRKHWKAEERKVLTTDEFMRWRRLGMKDLQTALMQNYDAYIHANAPSMSPATRDHIVSVMTEECVDAHIKVQDYMSDEENHYVQNIAAQGETIRTTREKLALSLSPEDMQVVDLMLDNMMTSMGLLGEQVAQSMDKQQHSSP